MPCVEKRRFKSKEEKKLKLGAHTQMEVLEEVCSMNGNLYRNSTVHVQ